MTGYSSQCISLLTHYFVNLRPPPLFSVRRFAAALPRGPTTLVRRTLSFDGRATESRPVGHGNCGKGEREKERERERETGFWPADCCRRFR
jgi:hypothetical protein